MDVLLIKIFATALTLSQVTTAPDALKTNFDRVADQQQVISLLRAGCLHMRKAFDIENIKIEDLLAIAMEEPEAIANTNAAFRGINFKDLNNAYRQFCTSESVGKWDLDLGAVIDFYDKAVADIPDPARLKNYRRSGASAVLDGKGEHFAELFEADQRRIWIPLSSIPEHVRKAFVAAEDKRFYQHGGIDERGLIRAFIANLGQSSRPQGGSTITQQVVKNLLVGDEVSYERKMRELILTVRVERDLSKDEILELYLNSVYLGRNSWGIETAANTYFGKSAQALTLAEGAVLAGLTKGPTYFSPNRHPERLRERLAYVLGRMQEDGAITPDESSRARESMPVLLTREKPGRNVGFHFVDQVAREMKSLAGIEGLASNSYTVHSTINPQLQRSVEEALQEGLSRYERSAGRVRFQNAEMNLAAAMRRMDGDQAEDRRPAWQRALINARLPLYDVHWTPAVVVEEPTTGRRSRGGLNVGLADGRILPLSVDSGAIQHSIKLHDVVFVRVADSKGKTAARAELRTRPEVQGAAVVLENKTGRILAMAGGFSYPLSQLNRVTQAQRQPGSAIKPLSYLAALEKGLQPNTLIRDQPITFPPISGNREGDYWSPKNYDGKGGGILTLQQALENSRNLATVHLLEGGIEAKPAQSLDRLCALAAEMRIYRECTRFYPFVLGAQPVRPIDLAAFYAAIANEGVRPTPHTVDWIEQDGTTLYRHAAEPAAPVAAADRAAFYQLKTMLQGVLQRGTANALAPLAPYAAGKTGTTEDENDAWFVGFTNEVTVAVWLGYDNANGRRTLGSGATGGHVAVPIFEPIIQAVWSQVTPRTELAPPPPRPTASWHARRSTSNRATGSGRGPPSVCGATKEAARSIRAMPWSAVKGHSPEKRTKIRTLDTGLLASRGETPGTIRIQAADGVGGTAAPGASRRRSPRIALEIKLRSNSFGAVFGSRAGWSWPVAEAINFYSCLIFVPPIPCSPATDAARPRARSSSW
jgi:penicillin-binding protein 1A